MKGPNTFMKQLQSDPWNYKLKDVGLPKYYFGGAFFCDNNGTLCYGSQIYAKHMCDNCFQLFKKDLPPKMHSASIKEDYPKLDVSNPCGSNDTAKFQSLIGALQWTIFFCCLDITNVVMTLGCYRAVPNVGHLECTKRIVGYLK